MTCWEGIRCGCLAWHCMTACVGHIGSHWLWLRDLDRTQKAPGLLLPHQSLTRRKHSENVKGNKRFLCVSFLSILLSSPNFTNCSCSEQGWLCSFRGVNALRPWFHLWLVNMFPFFNTGKHYEGKGLRTLYSVPHSQSRLQPHHQLHYKLYTTCVFGQGWAGLPILINGCHFGGCGYISTQLGGLPGPAGLSLLTGSLKGSAAL